MENYIRRYDNIVSSEFCDNMIRQFEFLPHQYEKHSQGEMSFTQIHFLAHDAWKTERPQYLKLQHHNNPVQHQVF